MKPILGQNHRATRSLPRTPSEARRMTAFRGRQRLVRRAAICSPPQAVNEDRIVEASGDLCASTAVNRFHRRCEKLITAEPPRAVLDLRNVTQADTKLVAVLVLMLRLARSINVALGIHVSPQIRQWITVCRVDQLLRPYLAIRVEDCKSRNSQRVPSFRCASPAGSSHVLAYRPNGAAFPRVERDAAQRRLQNFP